MKKNIRVIFSILVIILTICNLTACQPTPVEQVVTQKDNLEKLIQRTAAPTTDEETQAQGTEGATEEDDVQPAETKESTEKYQETLEFEDSSFKVIIDAVVDKPEGSIPVANVEPYMITQDDVDRALAIFMPNKQLYELIEEVDFGAKDSLQKQIFKLNALIAKIKGDETLDEEIRRSLIGIHAARLGLLESILNDTSINSLTWVETTSELKEVNKDLMRIAVKTDMEKSLFAYFIAVSSAEHAHSSINFVNDDFDGNIIGLKRINSDIPGMKTTFEEAKKLAEDTLTRLGTVDNFGLVYTELGVYSAVPDEDWISTKYITKRYMFYFAREINGIQVPNIEICKGFEQEGLDYDFKWGQEYIFVTVDDTGIIECVHSCPGKITEIINDNVEIIDFDEAMEIFRKQIFYEGVWTQQGITFSELNVTKIQLNMFRLRLKNKNEYMYVPVWDFIGTWKTNNYGTEPGKEYSFLTINAIDGSIINRNRGY